MERADKKRIKELKKLEKYDEIFYEFGHKIYKKSVPAKYRRDELKKLKEERRYEDIFNKYGEEEYNKILVEATFNEIKEAKGTLKAVLWDISIILRKLGIKASIGLATAATTITALGITETPKQREENAIKYEKEISQYNAKISDYAKEINSMELNDVQVFMKVMDDMWGQIKGYGEAQKDIAGFYELDLSTEDGQGVCRHMASDIAKKLNEIDSKYNARTMTVLIGETGDYYIADIQRKVIETNETVKDGEDEQEKKGSELLNTVSKVLGNHMITLVDVPEDNLILVLDPTNPGIGIYKDGKIMMFNSSEKDGLKFTARRYIDAVFFKGGVDGVRGVVEDYARSFEKSNLSLEEIESKYGLEAQNKALEEVKNLEEKDERKDFAEALKVDLPEKENEEEQIENLKEDTIDNEKDDENEI